MWQNITLEKILKRFKVHGSNFDYINLQVNYRIFVNTQLHQHT